MNSPGFLFFTFLSEFRHSYTIGQSEEWRVIAMREFKIFCCLADLHIGNKNIRPEDMKQQLKDHFFSVMKKTKYLDGIFILGDILHTIVSLNSEYSNLYLWFIDQVYKLAKKKGSTVVIIKGTPSHDNDQLNNIKQYMNNYDDVDFRIYEIPQEITIWNDYRILVLPDVKPRKQEEIGQYITEDKRYDMILGHGLIDTMKYYVQESEHESTKTYVYDIEKLKASCIGPILFGHIHQFQQLREAFYYVGPYTLLERGGINAGYVVGGIYDKDRSKYLIEQYVNPDSASYYDFDIQKRIMDIYSVEDIVSTIDEILQDSKSNDLITIRITRGDQTDAVDKVMMLEGHYRNDRRVSIIKKIKTKSEEETEKANQEKREQFSYILDNNLSLSEIMYNYYQTEVLPGIEDKSSATAKITLQDFKRILREEACSVILWRTHKSFSQLY